MLKKLRKILKLADTVYLRESDLWEYCDWKKTKALRKELEDEINSLLFVRILHKLATMLQCMATYLKQKATCNYK